MWQVQRPFLFQIPQGFVQFDDAPPGILSCKSIKSSGAGSFGDQDGSMIAIEYQTAPIGVANPFHSICVLLLSFGCGDGSDFLNSNLPAFTADNANESLIPNDHAQQVSSQFV